MSTSPRDAFVAGVIEARKQRGWTQQDVAGRVAALGMNLSHATLSKLEAGSRGVSLDEALALSAALNVSPATLISGALAGINEIAVADSFALSSSAVKRWLCGQVWVKLDHEATPPSPAMSDEEWAAQHSWISQHIVRRVQEFVDAYESGAQPDELEASLAVINAELGRLRRFESKHGHATSSGRKFGANGGG